MISVLLLQFDIKNEILNRELFSKLRNSVKEDFDNYKLKKIILTIKIRDISTIRNRCENITKLFLRNFNKVNSNMRKKRTCSQL